MKQNKFYYYDEKNDLTEYLEGNECTTARWVNPYLTLMFPMGCTELTPDNIIGFQLNEMKHLLNKAEEQASTPLTAEQEKQFEEGLMELGWKYSIDKNGDRIWNKE